MGANMRCYEPIILKPRRSASAALFATAGADWAGGRAAPADPSLPPGEHRARWPRRGSRRLDVAPPRRAPAPAQRLSGPRQKHDLPRVRAAWAAGPGDRFAASQRAFRGDPSEPSGRSLCGIPASLPGASERTFGAIALRHPSEPSDCLGQLPTIVARSRYATTLTAWATPNGTDKRLL
jgi:hypothetical protein